MLQRQIGNRTVILAGRKLSIISSARGTARTEWRQTLDPSSTHAARVRRFNEVCEDVRHRWHR